MIIVALPAGALADRFNRRRMLVMVELVRFGLMAVFSLIILFGHGSLGLIYAAAFVLGGLNIAFDVIGNSSLPLVVPPSELVRSNAHLLNADMTAESLVGPALGGAAFAISRALPFLANTASLAIGAVLLRGALPDGGPHIKEPQSTIADLREGISWFMSQGLLRRLTAVVASLAFCQGMTLGLLVIYARQDLHLSSAGFGLLLAVASIGTALGGLAAPKVHAYLGSGLTLVSAGVIFAFADPVLAVTHAAALAALAMFVQEAAVIIGNTSSQSLRHKIVPPDRQGRAASISFMVILSSVPFGSLLGGAIAGIWSIRSAFIAAGGVQLLLLIAGSPGLITHIRRSTESAPGESNPSEQDDRTGVIIGG